MTTCPLCDFENIEGVDVCDQCGQSLMDSDIHLREPATLVEKSLLHDRVRVLDPKIPIGVNAQAKVRDVIKLLVDREIGSVLVVEGDQLKGIFSERDALIKLGTRTAELGDEPVSKFMTPEPQTLEEGAKVAFAVQRMDLGSFRHVPIVNEGGKPIGVISVRDILRYLTDKMAAEIQTS